MADVSFASLRAAFDRERPADAPERDARLLRFRGADGYDVYNCSAPFVWNGKLHLFGRMERREDVAESQSCMFVATDTADEFELLEGPIRRQLEDPFVATIDGAFVLGGTQMLKDVGQVTSHYCDLYRGDTPERPTYFTTGADKLSHVRVVQLADGAIGVFAQMPHGTRIGFTKVAKLTDVCRDSTAQVQPIGAPEGLTDAAGVCVTHPYLLSSGRIGCLAQHCSATADGEGADAAGACATSFVYDPVTNATSDFKILATQSCFPDCPLKPSEPAAVAFPSGLVPRTDDDRFDLYLGVGNTREGRAAISYPFQGNGEIVSHLTF